jgi:acyl-CoA synthetase (AMP-forming)/AMP-acid ligase II
MVALVTASGTVNIAAYFTEMAKRQPNSLAIVVPHHLSRTERHSLTQWTYQELNEESDRLARGLTAIGIKRGVRTVLMVKPGLEFFALTFALFKTGAVPVMVDPGMGVKNLGQCLAEAAPEGFIGISKAQAARVLLGWAKKSIKVSVTVGRRFFWGGFSLDQVRNLGKSSTGFSPIETSPEETAAILFTSGSTGVPKGAVYTHGIFAAQVELLRQTYGIEPGEVDLPTFPLFALFGPALGLTAVIPKMDFTRPGQVDPQNIITAIEQFQVNNLFGSPALIDRVGRYGAEHKTKLPSLRRVISAGAPVSAGTLKRFSQLLSPGVQIFTPYGATEALPVSSIGSDEILNETQDVTARGGGVCVGRPVGGVSVQIIRISDDPIPTWSDDLILPVGQVGEIVVCGPVVTKEYFRRPDLTALSKIHDPKRNHIHHRMGDLGYLDDRGRIWFCGRKSQRVITSTRTFYTIPCEAVFNQHAQVRRSALVGVARNGSTEPVLCVELEKKSQGSDSKRLTNEILALGAAQTHTKEIQTVLFHPAFPVDIRHNAKIFREKLAQWAARKMS